VVFFGQSLGCTDSTIASPYRGPSLPAIHANMGVTLSAFNRFNEILLSVTAAAGVTPADNAIISSFLSSQESAIVYSVSLCDKYSNSRITSYEFWFSVTDRLVQGMIADPRLKQYFDGETWDYRYDRDAEGRLIDAMIKYFGLLYSCTDGTIANYYGRGLYNTHRQFSLNESDYAAFLNLYSDSLLDNNVDLADLPLFFEVVNSTKRQILDQPPMSPYFNAYPITHFFSRGKVAGILISAAFGAIVLAGIVLAISVAVPMLDKKD